MPYGTRILTPAAGEPMSRSSAKQSLGIDDAFTEDDNLIDELIAFGRDFLEKTFDTRLSKQQLEYLLPCFPRGTVLELELWPIQSVSYFKYRDSAGDEHSLTAGTDYKTRLHQAPAQIVLPYNGVWPAATLDTADAVMIGLWTGYISGDSPEPLPMPPCVHQSMRLIVGHGFDHRAPVIDDATAKTVRQLMINVRG